MTDLQKHPDECYHNLTFCMEWTEKINLWFCYISYCQVVFSLAGPWINPAGSASWILVTFKIPVTEIISVLMGIEVFTVTAVLEPKLCPEVHWRGEKSLKGHSARVTAMNAQSFVLSDFVFWAQARSDTRRHMRYWEERGWCSYGNIPYQVVSQSEVSLSRIQRALKCFNFSRRDIGSLSHELTITGSFFLTPEVLHTDCIHSGTVHPSHRCHRSLAREWKWSPESLQLGTWIFPPGSQQVPRHDLLCSISSWGGSRSYLDVPEMSKPWPGMGKSVPGLDLGPVLAGWVLGWIPGGTQMSPHTHCPDSSAAQGTPGAGCHGPGPN